VSVKQPSLKTKVTLIVTGGFVALLVLVSAVEMVRVRTDLAEVLGQEQFTLASRVAEEIDARLEATHAALIAESKGIPPEIIDDPVELRKNLADQAGLLSLFDGIFVYSPKGIVLVDLPDIGTGGRSVADRAYFQRTLADRKPLVSVPYVARVVNQPVITMTAPILDGRGEVVAVLAGTLNFLKPNFLGKLATANLGQTGRLALLGRDRTIILSREKERVMTQGPARGVSPYFDHATDGEDGWEENVNSAGLHAVFAYKQLRTVPWVLVAALPVEEAFAPIARAQTRIAFMTLALALLVAPIAWFGVRRMLTPLRELRDAIRRIRSDPGASPEVPVHRHDEIGDLAADFNALTKERNQTAAALRESAHRLRVIADHTPALIAYIDSETRYRFANATYGEWFGLSPKDIEGHTVLEVFGEEGYARRKPHILNALAGREVDAEVPIAMGGAERTTQIRYVPDRRDDGRVVGFFVLASDVTALKRTERMLRDSEQRLSLALGGSQLALFDWNIATGEVFLSEQWLVILGGRPEPTRTTFAALVQLTHPDDRIWLANLMREVLKGEKPHYSAEHRVKKFNGEWIWIQSDGQVTARGSDGRALRMVGTSGDISERKRAERELIESRAELERAARHDPLTGLPNRNLFSDRVDQALARARRGRQLVSLFYVDLDRFKEINDKLGHAAGDALLKAFAERLNGCVRESDTVARLGGDEFVVLLEELARPEDARAVATKILEATRRGFHLESRPLHVTASIGIAFTRGALDGEALLKQADEALYEAKGAGRNRIHVARAAEPLEEKPVRGARSMK
jgi:diguanylate cyclase (GGDEF)-like protein/PAS domain S-box-containing protein